MARKVKGSAGRPVIEIDWKKVDDFLKFGASGVTIAERLGIHPDTLYNRGVEDGKWGEGTDFSDFSAYKAHKREVMADNILMRQLEVAMGKKANGEDKVWLVRPDTSMLIWLGKNYCGQSDKQDINQTGQQPIRVEIKIDGKDLESDTIG